MNNFSNMEFKTVAIIGLGLIGGSMAKLIRYKLPQTLIYALDNDDILEDAYNEGVINEGLNSLKDPKLLETDLIVIGTHLGRSFSILKKLASLSSSKPLKIMDLGSTKSTICKLADSLEGNFYFIGGHPLAGREISGYVNSQWDMFSGKRFLLTACSKTAKEFNHDVILWLNRLGVLPVELDQDKHDELMSLVSHFPQFYAIALASLLERNNPDQALKFLGGGIDDQMRLMASPYEMWKDIFQDNKRQLNTILSEFILILHRMQESLIEDNFVPWFEASQEIYQRYQKEKQEKPLTMPKVSE